MVKVFTAEQIREADRITIEKEPIASIDLMERAAERAFQSIKSHFNEAQSYSIFCGVGNNGGDGLVIARLLQQAGCQVKVYIVEYSEQYSADFKANLDRLEMDVVKLTASSIEISISKEDVIVDAIFGTGLNRAAEGLCKEVIELINSQSNPTVAIDLPSGLFAEENRDQVDIAAIHENLTLSFQFPKISMLLPSYSQFIGRWECIDIGLNEEYIQTTTTDHFYFTIQDASSILKSRNLFAHKGNHGRALLIAGSKGKMGAAVLAAEACMRAGIGLLTVQIPKIGNTVMQSSIPEAMVLIDREEDYLSEHLAKGNFNAIGVGPGLGTHEQTQAMLKLLIQENSNPIVFDADALNILAENQTWISYLPKGSLLTPHPGEFMRLVGPWENDLERLTLQKDLSKKYGLYVVLKGRHTSISCPDGRVYFNSTGNPGMATAGSGDSLTGIITSFLAQSYAPEQAALLGVFVHGLSGDIAAEEIGEEAMIAGDIIKFLPASFKKLKGGK